VDVIVLLISNALTSGPLVIQRQVKALRRLGPSSPPDLYADQNLPVILIVSFVGGWMVLFFILQGIFNPLKEPDTETIVKVHLTMLPMIVPLSFLIAIASVMYRYLSHVIRSL